MEILDESNLVAEQDHIVKGNGLGWQSRKGRKKFRTIDKKRFVKELKDSCLCWY